MKKNNLITYLTAMSVSFSLLQAATVTLNTGGDAVGTSSYNSGSKWSDATAPSAANSYEVSVQWLRTPGDANSYTFGGASLELKTGGGLLYKGSGTAAAPNTYTINNFILSGGTVRSGSSSTNTMAFAGNMSVTGTGSTLLVDQSPIVINSVLSGSGALTVSNTFGGAMNATFNGTNTFTGNLTVTNGTSSTGNAILSATSTWKFVPTTNGVNNTIAGAGRVTLSGALNIDLTGASTTVGDSWTLINVGTLVETYNTTFSVTGFTSSGTTAGSRIWTKTAGSISYRYTESTGVLSVINPDADGDGLSDAWETANSLDPNDATGNNGATGDPDGDGATNLQEYQANTNPQLNTSWPDTDSDGLKDAWEVANFGNLFFGASNDFDADGATNLQEFTDNSSPIDRSSFVDTDADGLPDAWETAKFSDLTHDGTADTDADGSTDMDEFTANSDPNNVNWTPDKAILAHRWSFNGSLNDSVGSSNATIIDPDANSAVGGVATLGAADVSLAGGANGTSDYVNLGTNLLQGKKTPVTIEFWATETSVQNWSRIFDFGSATTEYFMMAWTTGTNAATDRVEWLDNTGATLVNNALQPYATGTKYHIVITIEPGKGAAGKTQVTYYAGAVGSALVAKTSYSVNATLETFNDLDLWLGRSHWTGDTTANASYDEFRIWDGVLSATYRDGFHTVGPNVLDLNDTDADGMPNAWETANGLDPNNASDATGDPDADLYTNVEEYIANTNPNVQFSSPDGDSDGLPDGWEVHFFRSSPSETLSDITVKYDQNADPDMDCATNRSEYVASTDPTLSSSVPDVNGDGIPDGKVLTVNNLLGSSGFDSGTGWEDGVAPAAGCNYYVPSFLVSGTGLRTPATAGDFTFAGDKLILQGSSTVEADLIVKTNAATGKITVPYLGLSQAWINQAAVVSSVITLSGSEYKITNWGEIWANNGQFIIDSPVNFTGTGELKITGGSTVTHNGSFTGTGNINVTPHVATTVLPTFVVSSTGSITLTPTTNNVSNKITGTGTLSYVGALKINLSGADATIGNTWQLIDVSTLTESFGAAFTVSDGTTTFTHSGTKHTLAAGAGVWTFDESTGVLIYGLPGFSAWISGTFAGGTVPSGQQGLTDDPDGDGLNNLLEYAFDGNDPTVGNGSIGSISGNTVTFTKRAVAVANGDVTYGIEESTDLGLTDAWSAVTPTVDDSSTISYTFTPGTRDFFRATATK